MNEIIKQLIEDKQSITGKGNVIKNNAKKENDRQQKIQKLNSRILYEYTEQFNDDPIPSIITKLDMNYIKSEVKKRQAEGKEKQAKGKNPHANATFLGNFRYMSLTCQREWCKAHSWHYYKNIPMATTNEEKMSSITNSWRDINNKTKLIVIGDVYKFDDIKQHLYKNQIKRIEEDKDTVWMDKEYNIPVIMESELHKQHPDYPNINNSTDWGKIT